MLSFSASFSEDDPNDSGIESSSGHPTLERRTSSTSEVFTAAEETSSYAGPAGSYAGPASSYAGPASGTSYSSSSQPLARFESFELSSIPSFSSL